MHAIPVTDFWARSCYIVSKQTLANIAASDQLTPLQALCSFLTEASPTLYGHPFAEDRTIQQLYQIAMTISEDMIDHSDDISNVVDTICFNNENILKKADAALFGVPGSSKAKKMIKRALDFNAAAKRKYCETTGSESDSSLEKLPTLKKKREAPENDNQDDLEFVIRYRENSVGKMNWKACLTAAHENNLCQKFSTGESLRLFYYRATKE